MSKEFKFSLPVEFDPLETNCIAHYSIVPGSRATPSAPEEPAMIEIEYICAAKGTVITELFTNEYLDELAEAIWQAEYQEYLGRIKG